MKVDNQADVDYASHLSARREDKRIEAAADAAMHWVDAETVYLFRKYKIPLPARLTKTTWAA